MSIKEKLKNIVKNTLIPESESYIYELHKNIEKDEYKDEDIEIIRDMESFLVELQNILAVIEKDEMPDKEYQRIYDNIMANIEKYEEEENEK